MRFEKVLPLNVESAGNYVRIEYVSKDKKSYFIVPLSTKTYGDRYAKQVLYSLQYDEIELENIMVTLELVRNEIVLIYEHSSCFFSFIEASKGTFDNLLNDESEVIITQASELDALRNVVLDTLTISLSSSLNGEIDLSFIKARHIKVVGWQVAAAPIKVGSKIVEGSYEFWELDKPCRSKDTFVRQDKTFIFDGATVPTSSLETVDVNIYLSTAFRKLEIRNASIKLNLASDVEIEELIVGQSLVTFPSYAKISNLWANQSSLSFEAHFVDKFSLYSSHVYASSSYLITESKLDIMSSHLHNVSWFISKTVLLRGSLDASLNLTCEVTDRMDLWSVLAIPLDVYGPSTACIVTTEDQTLLSLQEPLTCLLKYDPVTGIYSEVGSSSQAYSERWIRLEESYEMPRLDIGELRTFRFHPSSRFAAMTLLHDYDGRYIELTFGDAWSLLVRSFDTVTTTTHYTGPTNVNRSDTFDVTVERTTTHIIVTALDTSESYPLEISTTSVDVYKLRTNLLYSTASSYESTRVPEIL